MTLRSALAILALAVSPTSAAQSVSTDSTALAVVEAFHAALAAADTSAALALLADDAVVLEAGGVESRAEYAAHHLAADIEFARAVATSRTLVTERRDGDVAWVAQSSVSDGSFHGREVRSTGAELMVLARTETGWRIQAIHWSSRARR